MQKAFERNALEIAPLAFMRGRTLNNAFVILDEAQNTTPEQMKMFLTRIGFGAKAVVTGDVSQIDLPKTQLSGLIDAERVLKRVKGIAITRFSSADVVRHPLVARIVDAYDNARKRSAARVTWHCRPCRCRCSSAASRASSAIAPRCRATASRAGSGMRSTPTARSPCASSMPTKASSSTASSAARTTPPTC